MAMFGEPDYFDDEEEQLHFSNEPYMYEPEYTDEELREMDLQRVERESASAQAAAAEAAGRTEEPGIGGVSADIANQWRTRRNVFAAGSGTWFSRAGARYFVSKSRCIWS